MAQGDTVVIVGSGGRESALAWRIAQSPLVGNVYVIPGRVQLAPNELLRRAEKKIIPVPEVRADIEAILGFAKNEGARLILSGPEAPLVAGIADRAREMKLPFFGPSRTAAMITEGSKCAAVQFCGSEGIPIPRSACFSPGEGEELAAYLQNFPAPVVIKDDQLAGGKGVTITASMEVAEATARALFEKGHKLVVQERLSGDELTVTLMVSGERWKFLPMAQDHKVHRNQMTGGMKTLSSEKLVKSEMKRKIVERIIEPIIRGLFAKGIHYEGFLYIGIMVVGEDPYVLEFNCRLGDPEAQAILPRITGDFYEVLHAAARGEVFSVGWSLEPSLAVVLAGPGYPGPVTLGNVIEGLAEARSDDVRIFNAGIVKREDGAFVVGGGRFASVVAKGMDAEARVYGAIAKIHSEGMQFVGRGEKHTPLLVG